MKLPVFLNTVDACINKMSHENLEKFVHELARQLPECQRDEFISDLKALSNASVGIEFSDEKATLSVETEIENMIGILGKISDGERCLDSVYNEEWDDWYNSDVDEIFFSDPLKILMDVNRAVELVHICVDMELYEEEIKLAETLTHIEVYAEGVYSDYDGAPLEISDLFEHDLLCGKFENLVKECLYLSYMGNKLPNRAEKNVCHNH
jgi:hypothetical protein